MYVCGIDVGSLSTDIVLMDDKGALVGHVILLTGSNPLEAVGSGMEMLLSKTGVDRKDIGKFVATGAGRDIIDFADRKITEITCLAAGVHHVCPDCRTIIDIGGQDTKVIALSDKGKVLEFEMNDKCSAGTGRFLEVMANALGVPLDKMGSLSLKAEKAALISSVCTVFAESEVVSLVSQGKPVEEILKGVHESIADRVLSLAERLEVKERIALTGGVAKNIGVVKALEEKLGKKLFVYDEPQIVGAIGACVLALGKE